jgi:uncharacterized protein (DUF4213/DUF364 family)
MAREAAPSGGVALADVTCAGPTDAREWARLLLSSDPGETAIGLAVANAMLALAPAQAADIDGVDWLLQHARGRDVAVVGAFPFIDRELRPLARRVRVLEQRPAEGQMPESCAGDVLPQAEIVAITGGTLANHTLDALLHHTRPDAIRLLLGPSTPLTPALFRFGFHALAGVHVVDVDAARADVRAGRPFPRMRGLQRVTLLAPHPLRALDAPR